MNKLAPAHWLFACVLMPALFLVTPALAISADLAKNCRAMSFKIYPPARVGTKTGNGRAQLAYYRACITNNGTMPTNGTQQNTAPAAK